MRFEVCTAVKYMVYALNIYRESLSSRLLPKHVKFKIGLYRSIILFVVMYGCETCWGAEENIWN
jgi:hypothetical protein